jgi:hypothetical protein
LSQGLPSLITNPKCFIKVHMTCAERDAVQNVRRQRRGRGLAAGAGPPVAAHRRQSAGSGKSVRVSESSMVDLAVFTDGSPVPYDDVSAVHRGGLPLAAVS